MEHAQTIMTMACISSLLSAISLLILVVSLMRLKTFSPKTVKNVLELLERIINFGVKKGLCAGLGFKPKHPKVNNLKTEDLTPEQLAAFLKAIEQDPDQQAANLMKMALVTGMRKSEILKLECCLAALFQMSCQDRQLLLE